MMIALEK